MAEVNLQPQTISILDHGTNCGVDDLVVQADLNLVADFVLRFVVLGWHRSESIEEFVDSQGFVSYVDACAATPHVPLPTAA